MTKEIAESGLQRGARMYHESPEHRRLRTLGVECMRGGHIMCRDQHAQGGIERLGAVRVLHSRADGDACTVPPLFPYELRDTVAAILRDAVGEVPDVFVLRGSATPVDGLPSFVRVASAGDLEDALRHAPYLLIAPSAQVGRQVRAALPKSMAQTPVYAMVRSVAEAHEAYALSPPPDGLFIEGQVSEAELRALYRRQAESVPACGPYDGFSVGVLAHQGDYQLHLQALCAAAPPDVRVVAVGMPASLRQVQALVLPGGWSTIQGTIMQVSGVDKAVREFHGAGQPILAVCAGMILARREDGRACEHRINLDLLPVAIDNNELNGVYPVTGYPEPKVFSNGPVARPLGRQTLIDANEWDQGIRVLSRIESGRHAGKVVAVRSGHCFGFAFHEGIHGPFLDHCLAAC
jgi:5'-phosphate synthase pdxT subunit